MASSIAFSESCGQNGENCQMIELMQGLASSGHTASPNPELNPVGPMDSCEDRCLFLGAAAVIKTINRLHGRAPVGTDSQRGEDGVDPTN